MPWNALIPVKQKSTVLRQRGGAVFKVMTWNVENLLPVLFSVTFAG
jgi:hypothetical protein